MFGEKKTRCVCRELCVTRDPTAPAASPSPRQNSRNREDSSSNRAQQAAGSPAEEQEGGGMQTASKQGVSTRVGHGNPCPPSHRPPPCCSPLATTCSRLHTIDGEVHPGAVSRVVLRAVLVQEEHAALVPALVFRSEPLNLQRCPFLQPDSPWERSPKVLVTLVVLRAQERAQSPPVTLIKWGPGPERPRWGWVTEGRSLHSALDHPCLSAAATQSRPGEPRAAAGGRHILLNRRGFKGHWRTRMGG